MFWYVLGLILQSRESSWTGLPFSWIWRCPLSYPGDFLLVGFYYCQVKLRIVPFLRERLEITLDSTACWNPWVLLLWTSLAVGSTPMESTLFVCAVMERRERGHIFSESNNSDAPPKTSKSSMYIFWNFSMESFCTKHRISTYPQKSSVFSKCASIKL